MFRSAGGQVTRASLFLVLSVVCSSGLKAEPNNGLLELQRKAIGVLQTAMKEGKVFDKVHAAEALIWSGRPECVREQFLEQERIAGSEPGYRIGIWRVLYQTNAGTPASQEKYLQKIVAVLFDPKASDQDAAAETLGKLKYAGRSKLVLHLADRGKDSLLVSARWILANSGNAEDESRLAELLRSNDPDRRFGAAYAFRHFKTIRPPTLEALQDLAAKEPADGKVRCFVLGTLYTHLPAIQREPVKQGLLQYVAAGDTDRRYQACMALANWPTEDLIPAVEKLLGSEPLDERVGSAYVLLKIVKRAIRWPVPLTSGVGKT